MAGGAAVPLIAGGINVLGGVARGLMDSPYQVDPSYVQSLYGQFGDYGSEGAAAEGRVGRVTNPYATGAMWDEEWMRQQQQAYMDDLRARATGQRSVSREQAADTQGRMLGMMSGERATSSRFDRPGAMSASVQQQAMLPGAMWAQTEAQALQEQQQAQDSMQAYLNQQREQNQGALGLWGTLQNLETGQGLAAMQAGKGHVDLGQMAAAWQRQAGVYAQGIKAAEWNK